MTVGVLAGPEEWLPEDARAGEPAPEAGIPALDLAAEVPSVQAALEPAAAVPAAPDPAASVPAAPDPIGVRLTDQGIIEVTVPPDQVIEGRQACAARAAVRSLAQARRTPVLLVITGVLGVSIQARHVYVNAVQPPALALVGESPVDRVIAHYLLRWTTDKTPAQFFTSEPDAIRWLRQYARED